MRKGAPDPVRPDTSQGLTAIKGKADTGIREIQDKRHRELGQTRQVEPRHEDSVRLGPGAALQDSEPRPVWPVGGKVATRSVEVDRFPREIKGPKHN